MTQRYMHLSPAALDAAIRLLDRPGSDQSISRRVETGPSALRVQPNRQERSAFAAAPLPPSGCALRWTSRRDRLRIVRRLACLDEARPKGKRSLAVRQGFEF
jgi:hypothetical protein